LERINNPEFNYVEFDVLKVWLDLIIQNKRKEWAAKTNAIGLMAKTGRYGGTYAHVILPLNLVHG